MKLAIEGLKFDERGLIPAIVQDIRTKEVLTLAFMNEESLRRTLVEGETWFWSRSREQLWHKGESSGNTQRVIEVAVDCDADALRILVEPKGPACHTGAHSCFHHQLQNETHDGSESGADNDADGEVHDVAFHREFPEFGHEAHGWAPLSRSAKSARMPDYNRPRIIFPFSPQ